MKRWSWLVLLCACAGPKIVGTATVDGKDLDMTTCIAGPAKGFWGADFVGANGTTLRLVYDPKGQAIAYLFDPGATIATELGACGTMTIVNMHLEHAHGSAKLQCTTNGRTLTADFSFSDCEFEVKD